MRVTPTKLLRAMSDATIGAAIVMVHVVLADRERARSERQQPPRTKPPLM